MQLILTHIRRQLIQAGYNVEPSYISGIEDVPQLDVDFPGIITVATIFIPCGEEDKIGLWSYWGDTTIWFSPCDPNLVDSILTAIKAAHKLAEDHTLKCTQLSSTSKEP